MKICKHIAYFYIEDRIKYIERIIKEAKDYPYKTDIFIHTNVESIPFLETPVYDNGKFQVIYHDLTGLNPYSLTEMPRKMLKNQKDEYDIFMYLEDDILVSQKAIMYWLKYNELCIENKYNLGFLRIETSQKDNNEYITDLYGEKMNKRIELEGQTYCINDKNPYCAFWIYNKKEFASFVESSLYDIKNVDYDGDTRASCAAGLHGKNNNWYKNTILPMKDRMTPISDCKIYHMTNNYVDADHSGINKFGTILFDGCVE